MDDQEKKEKAIKREQKKILKQQSIINKVTERIVPQEVPTELDIETELLLEDKKEEIDNLSEIKIKVYTFLLQKETDEATELLTDYISEKFRFYTVEHNEQPDMWVYQDGIYVNLGKHVIKEECRKILEVAYKLQLAMRVINKIEADTGISAKAFFADNNIYEVPIMNGVLNIKTKTLTEYTPDKIFFNKLPIEYSPNAECPKIKTFFNEVLEHGEQDSNLVFEHIGNHLLKDMRFEKSIMALGSGSNGKSILISLLRTFLGEDNYSSIPLERLNTNDTTALAEMHGKLGNIVADLGKKALKDTGTFKTSTGGDSVSAKRKFKSDFKYKPYAKHTYSCNELPIVYDTSDGFWRRWAIINFPNSYYSKEEMRLDQTKKSEKVADKNLINNLSTKEEMSGLLNESLKGLHRLFINGYSTSQSINQVKESWEKQSNNIPFFINDILEEDWSFVETKANMKRKYCEWCSENKLSPLSDREFNTSFKNELKGVSEVGNRVLGIYSKCWKGVRIRPTETIETIETIYSKSPTREYTSRTLRNRVSTVSAVSEEQKNKTEKANKKVIILKDFAEVIGTDLKSYGPFKIGDEVELPEDMVEAFSKCGTCKIL